MADRLTYFAALIRSRDTWIALSYIFGGVLFRMTDGWPAALWWFVCGALTCWALVSPILALCRRNAFDSIALLEARDE
jgi:hypothetical protein